MSLVEIYLAQPVFVFPIQCVTQRSRLRVLLHFADNTYNYNAFAVAREQACLKSVISATASIRCFCTGLANCYFAEQGLSEKRK